MRQHTPDEVSGIHELPRFPEPQRAPDPSFGAFPRLDTPAFPLVRRRRSLAAMDDAFAQARGRPDDEDTPSTRAFVARFIAWIVLSAVLGLLACEVAVQHARSWQDVRGLVGR
jgi:hypothetical protein